MNLSTAFVKQLHQGQWTQTSVNIFEILKRSRLLSEMLDSFSLKKKGYGFC
jgi:hypothetical protein